MKLKGVGLKFALGSILLLLFFYILISFRNVFADKTVTLANYQYAQFAAQNNSALIIFGEEAIYLHNDEALDGSVDFEDGVIYFNNLGNEYVFITIDKDTLFLTKELLYFIRTNA